MNSHTSPSQPHPYCLFVYVLPNTCFPRKSHYLGHLRFNLVYIITVPLESLTHPCRVLETPSPHLSVQTPPTQRVSQQRKGTKKKKKTNQNPKYKKHFQRTRSGSWSLLTEFPGSNASTRQTRSMHMVMQIKYSYI